MKFSNANLLRLAGLSAVLAGLCYVFVGVFHPENALASVSTTRWAIVHVVACAMSFFGVLGLAGIYARQAFKTGWLGLVGYLMLSLWMVLIMGFSFVEAFVLPHLVTETPAFIEGWMSMFNGGSSTIDLGVLPSVWTLNGAALHSWRAAVRYCDVPSSHPPALGWRAARGGHGAGPAGQPAVPDGAAEDRDSHRAGTGLVGVRADDRADGAEPDAERAGRRGCRMTTVGTRRAHRDTSSGDPSYRRVSRAAGILYVLTFISIPTLALYGPVKGANYILRSGPDTAAIVGGLLEITIALAGIGTAVVLFPVLKKQNETFALGLVAARILESATIFVGVAFLLSVVTLRQDGSGAGALLSSHVLVTLYDRIFLLGQSFMPAICDLLLGYLLFRSRLVPRGLAVIGMVGAPLLVAGYLAILFGRIDQHGAMAGLSALLVAVFEFSLGVWLIVKGFDTRAVARLDSKD